MKKFMKLLLVLVVAVMPFTVAQAKKTTTTAAKKNPVTLYEFYGEECPHCAELNSYLDELKKDNTINYMFKIVKLEVWHSESNSETMNKVASYFKYEVTGVPFYVIGEKYFSGFGENSKSVIVSTIKEAYNNKDYKDIVALVTDGKIKVDDPDVEEDNKSTIIAIVAIGVTLFVVLLIIFGRSKSSDTYYEDEEVEEVVAKAETKVATKVATKKPVAKKTATKKPAAKKAPAKKAPAKKTTSAAKKTTSTAKKTTTKKTTAKKTTTTKKTK